MNITYVTVMLCLYALLCLKGTVKYSQRRKPVVLLPKGHDGATTWANIRIAEICTFWLEIFAENADNQSLNPFSSRMRFCILSKK